MSFAKILVANRGEIACRVMRTARALGYRTVAVFSDADAAAPHVRQADEAVRIGPAPAAESYLHMPALLAAAQATGADAVHPGYGFLSEQADFAQACAGAGLVFIGPPPAAIRAMGDKAEAKRRMVAAGVPCAPGYWGDAQDDATLTAQAATLGLPLLVKALAGGGGRGMRLVHHLDALPAALAGARRESHSAFGDSRLMLERLVPHGRHIEIQVFADQLGHAVHLGERDCSAQRRRQKLIEEAPAPSISPALRAQMGADAVAATLAVGYVGAGTVEFIVDGQMQHYFLEMNTRLQVEHPVTEAITGIDLVEWQLRVAAGEPLPLRQDQITFTGHAIEARLVAEDPYDGFKPQTGRVLHWQPGVALQPGVRIDHGITEGVEITPWYDAMVAKIIVHGPSRADAQRRLRAALADTPLIGPVNNGRFLHDLLGHPAFTSGAVHTTLIDDWANSAAPLLQRPLPDDAVWLMAAAVRALGTGFAAPAIGDQPAPAGLARPPGLAAWQLTLQCQGQQRRLAVQADGNAVQITLAGATHRLRLLARDGAHLRIEHNGVQRSLIHHDDGQRLHLVWLAATYVFSEPSAWPSTERTADARRVLAPVAGTVAQVAVQVGDRVAAGQPLVCVEAMKMAMWQPATAAGTVQALHVAAHSTVAAGALLIELTLDEPAPEGPR